MLQADGNIYRTACVVYRDCLEDAMKNAGVNTNNNAIPSKPGQKVYWDPQKQLCAYLHDGTVHCIVYNAQQLAAGKSSAVRQLMPA